MADVAIANQKGFKLKEDIRVLVGGQELFGIFARQVLDFSASYDIVDLTVTPNVRIGVLRRKGWKSSFVRDEWVVMDAFEKEIGTFFEDSAWMGVLRRMIDIARLVCPQNYDMVVGGTKVADFKQNFNPFNYHLNVLLMVPPEQMDRRIVLAAAILAAAIEGKQH
jgi:hypothetical protein